MRNRRATASTRIVRLSRRPGTRWLLLALLLAGTAILFFAVYQYRPAHTVNVGTTTDDKPYVVGFHEWPGLAVGGGRAFNPGWNLVFEVGNLLTVAEAVATLPATRSTSAVPR